MMFAGFLFLLLLTGGSSSNHTEPPDGEGVHNQSHLDCGSSYNHTEPPDGDGVYNQSHLDRGCADNNTEPLENGRVDDQNRRRSGSADSNTKPPVGGRVNNRKKNQRKSDLRAHCTYASMIKHFDLMDKVKFYMTRPTKDFLKPTDVKLYIYIYSILDVKEKEQELVAYFWINMMWKNEFIKWKREDLCGINDITLPSELLWKPDITIEEVTTKEKLFQTPFLTVNHYGMTYQKNGMVLVSTCKMRFYRFPFDTQTCSLTFKSIQHYVNAIKIISGRTSEDILNKSRTWMQTESEWLLMNVTVETERVYKFGFTISVLVYTMTTKRRSVLYVANFIVPILFFLCLDLASFLISESGGEKLSFKVTVLLAVTVMQLILNDILPSSSDRIPLIAVYCIGVFTLMMLSLLETILMMYLMEKDDVSQDQEADKDQSLGDDCRDQPGKVQSCFGDMKKSIPCVRVFDESPGETPPELLPEVKEGSSSQLTEEIHDLQNLTELRELLKTVALLLSSRKEEKEPGYWTRMTKTLNRIYFIFYIITVSVFLGYVFSVWLKEDTKK